MTGSQIDVLLKTMALVGTLLLIGTFLRAKVSLFQNLFLPACVIGGIIGLILGPRMLGVLPISDEIMTTASNMPGRFFALIIAALPMCSQKLKKGELFQRIDAIKLGIIISLISALQFAIGFLTNIVFTKLGLEMYSGYGLEMMLGFCGGHGTAAAESWSGLLGSCPGYGDDVFYDRYGRWNHDRNHGNQYRLQKRINQLCQSSRCASERDENRIIQYSR